MYDAIDVLSNGLSATRTRMNVLASNIANAETTRTPEGGPYKRRDIIQVADRSPSSFRSTLDRLTLHKPHIDRVVEDQSDPKLVYQPGHPDANDQGYVAYPNINVVTTMTDMMSASRLYQANVTSIQTMKQMLDAASRISLRF